MSICLFQNYIRRKGRMQLERVDGLNAAKTMATQIGQMLQKKVDALNVSLSSSGLVLVDCFQESETKYFYSCYIRVSSLFGGTMIWHPSHELRYMQFRSGEIHCALKWLHLKDFIELFCKYEIRYHFSSEGMIRITTYLASYCPYKGVSWQKVSLYLIMCMGFIYTYLLIFWTHSAIQNIVTVP